MIKPMENKSQEVRDAIEELFPGTAKAIDEKKCPLCKQPIGEFKNELSKKEYLISGMCQKCQDEVFSSNEN